MGTRYYSKAASSAPTCVHAAAFSSRRWKHLWRSLRSRIQRSPIGVRSRLRTLSISPLAEFQCSPSISGPHLLCGHAWVFSHARCLSSDTFRGIERRWGELHPSEQRSVCARWRSRFASALRGGRLRVLLQGVQISAQRKGCTVGDPDGIEGRER